MTSNVADQLTNIKAGELPSSINKVILHAGKGGGTFPEYGPGTRVTFHFQTINGEDIVDDTRKMQKPMELILGKKFKLEIWESMVKTMAKSEVARFTVPKIFVICYPVVSKALRDSQKPKEAQTGHHCCGMMNQGCGYPDLDKLMDKMVNLDFIFEILDIEMPGQYEKEGWQLTMDEKLASIPTLKKEGNDFFQRGIISEATLKYHEAISRLEQLSLREKPGSEESQIFQDMKVPLLLNYSLCLMKSGEYYQAIEHLTTALSIEPKNVKGYFRRAKCHVQVGDFSQAKLDFSKSLEIDPTLKTVVGEELKGLSELENKKNLEDKDKFKSLFT